MMRTCWYACLLAAERYDQAERRCGNSFASTRFLRLSILLEAVRYSKAIRRKVFDATRGLEVSRTSRFFACG